MIVNYYLDNRTGKSGDAPIRVSIYICGVRLLTSTGYSINPQKWDSKKQRVKQGCSNSRGITYNVINSHLASIEKESSVFEQRCLSEHINVTKDLIKQNVRMNNRRLKASKEHTLFDYFDEFVSECGKESNWSDSTYKKFASVRNHLLDFNKDITFDDFNVSGLVSYKAFLETKLDMRNSTVIKQIKFLKWFLRWANDKGYNKQIAFSKFKTTYNKDCEDTKPVVYLDKEELMTVYNFNIPETKKYLERVRDVFCFCCFTSLRYSDVYNLKRGDVKEKSIFVTTIKTGKPVEIELNKFSKAILDKYKDYTFEKDKALPVISNQKMNDYIKELGKMCGIDEPIRETYYKGSVRNDNYYPKYELMGTHTGRRTFICNALLLGIPANVIMKWTGHRSYKSMQVYIDVTDKAKEENMNLFNNM